MASDMRARTGILVCLIWAIAVSDSDIGPTSLRALHDKALTVVGPTTLATDG